MDSVQAIVIFAIGILIRIGIPIAITFLVAWWLRRLDERWKKETELVEQGVLLAESIPAARPVKCWELKGCAPAQISKCPAFQHQEIPCWQLFKDKRGHLREKCSTCLVLKTATAPVTI